jgi:hypothetical protein
VTEHFPKRVNARRSADIEPTNAHTAQPYHPPQTAILALCANRDEMSLGLDSNGCKGGGNAAAGG